MELAGGFLGFIQKSKDLNEPTIPPPNLLNRLPDSLTIVRSTKGGSGAYNKSVASERAVHKSLENMDRLGNIPIKVLKGFCCLNYALYTIYWVVPPPSKSHHQDYYMFNRESL